MANNPVRGGQQGQQNVGSQGQAAGVEIFRPGDKVMYSGEYTLVDQQGNRLDYDFVTLDEGESFPRQSENVCYMLNDTCMEESCEPVGGQTPEVE